MLQSCYNILLSVHGMGEHIIILYYWRAGASQPSRTTGTIFVYISGNALTNQNRGLRIP